MSNLLDRLAQNARAYLHEWLLRFENTERSETGPENAPDEPDHFGEPRTAASPLHDSPGLADAYRVLDLPFGAPLREANERWKSYLKRCHPDRFHNDPERQADAADLSRHLNAAHDVIEAAWQRAGGGESG